MLFIPLLGEAGSAASAFIKQGPNLEVTGNHALLTLLLTSVGFFATCKCANLTQA